MKRILMNARGVTWGFGRSQVRYRGSEGVSYAFAGVSAGIRCVTGVRRWFGGVSEAFQGIPEVFGVSGSQVRFKRSKGILGDLL